MRLEKTRDAIRALAQTAQRHYEGAPQERVVVNLRDDATAEVEQAEALLREAATLKTLAAAGLSAFHGNMCLMSVGPYPESASECADPKCRAWASAVQGNGGLEAYRNEVLEDAARTAWRVCLTDDADRAEEAIRAMKTEGK